MTTAAEEAFQSDLRSRVYKHSRSHRLVHHLRVGRRASGEAIATHLQQHQMLPLFLHNRYCREN